MSWSIGLIGTPEKVAKALQEQSEKMSGQSKAEYDAALPHLVALVKQNWKKDADILISIDANGSGTTSGTEEIQRSCGVTIKQIWGALV